MMRLNLFISSSRLLQFEYPTAWPSFFQDLIGAMAHGEGIVDMFCRILVAVDEDIVSLDIPRSQEESKLSMHIKVHVVYPSHEMKYRCESSGKGGHLDKGFDNEYFGLEPR